MPIIIDGLAPSGEYPKVQFVDAPDTSANVRLDLNYGRWSDEHVWPDHAGFSIGAPTLEGDPGTVGVEYGFRQLTFNQLIRTTKVTAQRVMSAIAKELLRQDNWLLFQLSANSSPVWFRTYRTSPGALDFEFVASTDDAVEDVWGISVTLDADPFAYGARVTLPAVTITNDPSTGTNPCLYWLPDIVGDAPAPLVVQDSTVGWVVLLSTTAFATQPTGYVAPFRIPTADGSGLSAVDSDTSTYSSSAYIDGAALVTSFATNAALVTRASGTGITVRSGASTAVVPLPPGAYRAFLRVGFDSTPSTFQVRLGQQNGSGSYLWNDTVTTSAPTSGSSKQYLDLGTISHPFGNPVPEGSRYASYTQTGPSLAIQASRTVSPGSLYLDDLILVPADVNDADTQLALITLGKTIALPTGIIYDGETERVIMLTGATQFGAQSVATQVAGGFPTVTPGAANLLHYMPTMTTDSLTSTASLTLSYQPQWLYLGAS